MPRTKKVSKKEDAQSEKLPASNANTAVKEKSVAEKRAWRIFDASKTPLGRISTEIAQVLMGKSKPEFVRNQDNGDYAIVINADTLKVTGNKEKNKLYYSHSGYPGGFKQKTLEKKRIDDSRQIVIHSVSGMLPDNKLKPLMLKRLFVYKDSNHPYTDKIKI